MYLIAIHGVDDRSAGLPGSLELGRSNIPRKFLRMKVVWKAVTSQENSALEPLPTFFQLPRSAKTIKQMGIVPAIQHQM